MKKSLAVLPDPGLGKTSAEEVEATIGIDLGDRWSHCCVVDCAGRIVQEERIRTTSMGVEERKRHKLVSMGTRQPTGRQP